MGIARQGNAYCSMKQSEALWLLLFSFFCWSSFCYSHCIPRCLHSLQSSFSRVLYQVQEVFLFIFLKGEKGRKTLALQFTPSTPGRSTVGKADRKTLLTFYNGFLRRLGHFFWTNKISNNLNPITGSQTITKSSPGWAVHSQLSTTGGDCLMWVISLANLGQSSAAFSCAPSLSLGQKKKNLNLAHKIIPFSTIPLHLILQYLFFFFVFCFFLSRWFVLVDLCLLMITEIVIISNRGLVRL